MLSTIAIVESIVSGLLLAALLGSWSVFRRFIREQRELNYLMSESIASMQREVIIRAFQRHIEDGKPMSVEEMDHLDACYEAYTASGHDGTARILYEKTKHYAVMTTKVGSDA